MVSGGSAAALYSCDKCACFFLGFDSHDVIDAMIAEDSAAR